MKNVELIEWLKTEGITDPRVIEDATFIFAFVTKTKQCFHDAGGEIEWITDYSATPNIKYPTDIIFPKGEAITFCISPGWYFLHNNHEEAFAALSKGLREVYAFVCYSKWRDDRLREHREETLAKLRENKDGIRNRLLGKVDDWKRRDYKPAGRSMAISA